MRCFYNNLFSFFHSFILSLFSFSFFLSFSCASSPCVSSGHLTSLLGYEYALVVILALMMFGGLLVLIAPEPLAPEHRTERIDWSSVMPWNALPILMR